ncbi:MAG: DUF1802 family protein [candidate division NC10 bacterium]
MLEKNRYALKEWAVVLWRLGKGDQVILPRKGGILEQKRGFSVEHREFFLFPTYVHESEEELIPPIRNELAQAVRGSSPPDEVWLDYYATVEEAFWIGELSLLKKLDGLHALTWSAMEDRFHYRRPGLHVLALRVFRLPATLKIPNTPRYNGCVSWVELDAELPTGGATPVLGDHAFAVKLGAVRAALAPVPASP